MGLDLLFRKGTLNRLVHKTSMAKNSNSWGTNQPQNSRYRRRKDTQHRGGNEKTSVKLRARQRHHGTQAQVGTLKHTNTEDTKNNKRDNKQEQKVGYQTVNGQKGKNNGIVGGKVRKVEVHTALNLAKTAGLADAAHIKKVLGGLDVGETWPQRTSLILVVHVSNRSISRWAIVTSNDAGFIIINAVTISLGNFFFFFCISWYTYADVFETKSISKRGQLYTRNVSKKRSQNFTGQLWNHRSGTLTGR